MSWSEFTRDQKLVTVFTVLTGLMHLLFAYQWKDDEAFGFNLAVLFVINGIGYFVFLYLLYFDSSINLGKNVAAGLLGAWTLGTIIGWFLEHPGDLIDQSLPNKIIEVLLLVFLYLDFAAGRSGSSAAE
ncbi:MAG: hypothetical protein ACW99A_07380 [Candidatus Kariarchaeaceae archaeon]